MRGNSIGIGIGALPDAGSDVGTWIAYAVSKRFSKESKKFGTGHVEGIVESTAANNAANLVRPRCRVAAPAPLPCDGRQAQEYAWAQWSSYR